jgi:hypothetical protein
MKKKFFVMHSPINSNLYNQFSPVLKNFKPGQTTRRTMKNNVITKQLKNRRANKTLMQIFQASYLFQIILIKMSN